VLASTSRLAHLTGQAFSVETRSIVTRDGVEYAFAREANGNHLLVLAAAPSALAAFEGSTGEYSGGHLLIGPAIPHNAAALRTALPWLKPQPLGLRTSAGLGDRLGLATPGHVRAVRATGSTVAPIFAQQSIREMTRTVQTPQQVMDAATWGMFAEGWQDRCGADADHLKTPEDIDVCAAAGFTFYTVDPGQYVNDQVETMSPTARRAAYEALPWTRLEDTPGALEGRYLTRPFDYGTGRITVEAPALYKTAVKYGGVVAHVVSMYRHLVGVMGDRPFELEISVDETENPTTPIDHLYLAHELHRLAVRWVSLAPRYIGRFEKGVDYIGDVVEFGKDFAVHAAIARTYGPYKLSLHSGSDKFSIYGVAAQHTRGLVHLKTAGTSYLEALRTVAAFEPGLFREIYGFALEHYDADKVSYRVSAQLERAPKPGDVKDSDLPAVCDQFDARQALHVTFGSVLNWRNEDDSFLFKDRLYTFLNNHPEGYAERLEAHFIRHLQPFAEHVHTAS